MKKILSSNKFLILLIIGSLICISMSNLSAAPGDNIYVNAENGNDNNDGLTALTAKKTIENATRVVNTGGTIHLSEGTYSGVNNTKIIRSFHDN